MITVPFDSGLGFAGPPFLDLDFFGVDLSGSI